MKQIKNKNLEVAAVEAPQVENDDDLFIIDDESTAPPPKVPDFYCVLCNVQLKSYQTFYTNKNQWHIRLMCKFLMLF